MDTSKTTTSSSSSPTPPCVYHSPTRSILERVKNYLRERQHQLKEKDKRGLVDYEDESESEEPIFRNSYNSRNMNMGRGKSVQKKPKDVSQFKVEALKKHLCSCPSSSFLENLKPISLPLKVIASFPSGLEYVQTSLNGLLKKYDNHLVILNFIRVIDALVNGRRLAPLGDDKDDKGVKEVKEKISIEIKQQDVGVFISKKGFKEFLPENVKLKVEKPESTRVEIEITAPSLAEFNLVKAALQLRAESVTKARETHRKNQQVWQKTQLENRERMMKRRRRGQSNKRQKLGQI